MEKLPLFFLLINNLFIYHNIETIKDPFLLLFRTSIANKKREESLIFILLCTP